MDDQNMHEYGNHYDDDQLKPCPFCGAEAEIITLAGEDDQGMGAQCVQCTSSACGAASGLIYPLMDDVTDLLYEHWNKRFNAGVEPPPAISAVPTASTKLLLEHSGCGHGRQTEQITIGLHRGDKVVLIMGAYTAAMHKGGEP